MKQIALLSGLLFLSFLLVACTDNNTAQIQTQSPSITTVTTITRAISPPSNSIAATKSNAAPLPSVETTLGAVPQDCPISGPPPKELNSDYGLVIGGSPLWVVSDYIQHLYSNAGRTQYGYSAKILWVMEPDNTNPVTLRAFYQRDSTPLWFKIGADEPTISPVLDPKKTRLPGMDIVGAWKDWPSFIYIPKAGCYTLEAQWSGGSWKLNIAAGL